MDRNDYLDYHVFNILYKLSLKEDGLRYSELQKSTNISHASLVNRLDKLKDSGYIINQLGLTKHQRPYAVYVLSQFGKKLLETLEISRTLDLIEDLVTNHPSSS